MIKAGLFITGTDTGIGKTVITAGLLAALRNKGIDAVALKPVQTGAIKKKGRLVSEDAQFYRIAADIDYEEDDLSGYCLENPLAPSVAAELEGKSIDLGGILEYIERMASRHDFVLIEGVGGLLVPLIGTKVTIMDLALMLKMPLLIVARPGLGTINHTALTVSCAKANGLEVSGIIINGYDHLNPGLAEQTNPGVIESLTGIPVIGLMPKVLGLSVEDAKPGELVDTIERYVDIDALLGAAMTHKSVCRKTHDDYQALSDWDKAYVWHPFTQMKMWNEEEPLIIEKGEGSYLIDVKGNRYLDGVSSLWVTVHGHCQPELTAAIKNQADKIAHSTLLGLASVPSIKLAKKLVEITPEGLNKVFYSDSGATAVEIALKMAYQYWQQQGTAEYKSKKKFLSLGESYHGDTVGAVSVGGIDLFHGKFSSLLFDGFKAPPPYCYRCPLGKDKETCKMACLDAAEEVMAKHHKEIAAMLVEPLVQGAAGMITAPSGYLKGLEKLCSRYNILLIADEVAVGFGRTGTLFACEQEGVKPDLMCIAKGLTGGYLPLAATLATDKIYGAFLGEYEEFKTFFHGHTYTGNPLGCAVALANIELIEKRELIKHVQDLTSLLSEELMRFKALKHVGDIRQCGLMVGIELVKNKENKEPYPVNENIGHKVILKARERGLIIRPLGPVIVLMPILSMSEEELREVLDITYWAIKTITEN